jgi:glycosyltransferase involved in cell wall biosynthesis
MRPIRVAVYGDINLNIIDGSAIWLTSLVETLLQGSRVAVSLLLKAPEQRDLLTAALRRLPRLTVVPPPTGARMRPDQALDALVALDRAQRFDVVLLRGFALAEAAVARAELAGRLWTYLTDIPQRPEELTPEVRAVLTAVVDGSERLLCQTEELRSYLEGIAPRASGKATLLPPMIPPSAAPPARPRRAAPRLFYAGKFAPLWGVLETIEQAAVLARRLPGTELHIAGDKVHDPPDDPGYKPAVQAALASAPALVWHGGVPRQRVGELLGEADVALSVRHPALDDSLELSTKILEYGAAGVPVVLNRNALHEELYGRDYPLFVSSLDEVADVIEAAWRDPARLERAQRTCERVSRSFTFPAVYDQVAPYLEEVAPEPPTATVGATARPRVLVAGHDLKFFTGIARQLERAGAQVRVDLWDGHDRHDPARSRDLLAEADTIVCEWTLGNVAWYAAHKRPGQRLVTRFHRQERETPYPRLVDASAVDAFVFVGEALRREARSVYGWPHGKLLVIPNGVDPIMHDRPKLPGAEFNLGMLGYVPARKRLHLALDLLERLRARDPRFHLYLKGGYPWDVAWVWGRGEERLYFDRQFARVRSSALLREAVSIEGFGPVASWYRKIGVILSLSEHESFHLGLAEGMAARCLPVIAPWDGADELYAPEWISPDVAHAAERVQLAVADGTSAQQGVRARQQVCGRYDLRQVNRAWVDLVLAAQPLPRAA